jgi:hypothetical protein
LISVAFGLLGAGELGGHATEYEFAVDAGRISPQPAAARHARVQFTPVLHGLLTIATGSPRALPSASPAALLCGDVGAAED